MLKCKTIKMFNDYQQVCEEVEEVKEPKCGVLDNLSCWFKCQAYDRYETYESDDKCICRCAGDISLWRE